MKISLILFILVVSSACGQKKNNLKTFPVAEEKISRLLNSEEMPANPNLNSVKKLVNYQYPVEIALYSDHSFFYHLEKLGTGRGTWKYQDGHLELNTKRKILNLNVNMNYKVEAKNAEGTEFIIHFEDRFGVNMLDVTEVNI